MTPGPLGTTTNQSGAEESLWCGGRGGGQLCHPLTQAEPVPKKGSAVWKCCGFKPEDDEQQEAHCKGCLQSFLRGYLTNVLRTPHRLTLEWPLERV